MYKLPTLGSISSMAPKPEPLSREGEDDLPFSYDPAVIGDRFPNVPNFPKTEPKPLGEEGSMDYGREGGLSVADIFRMNKTPYSRDAVYDLTNYSMNSKSPYNPNGEQSVLAKEHWVRPPDENKTNNFFYKPFDQMNDREQTDFHAYHPNINNATKGMTYQEKKAYEDARFGYDNSAYFKTRPVTKVDYYPTRNSPGIGGEETQFRTTEA